MATVWRVKATEGSGWLRDVDPIVTADVLEARQFATLASARAACRALPADRVPMVPVQGEAALLELRGLPT